MVFAHFLLALRFWMWSEFWGKFNFEAWTVVTVVPKEWKEEQLKPEFPLYLPSDTQLVWVRDHFLTSSFLRSPREDNNWEITNRNQNQKQAWCYRRTYCYTLFKYDLNSVKAKKKQPHKVGGQKLPSFSEKRQDLDLLGAEQLRLRSKCNRRSTRMCFRSSSVWSIWTIPGERRQVKEARPTRNQRGEDAQ